MKLKGVISGYQNWQALKGLIISSFTQSPEGWRPCSKNRGPWKAAALLMRNGFPSRGQVQYRSRVASQRLAVTPGVFGWSGPGLTGRKAKELFYLLALLLCSLRNVICHLSMKCSQWVLSDRCLPSDVCFQANRSTISPQLLYRWALTIPKRTSKFYKDKLRKK